MSRSEDLLLVGLSHHTAPVAVREKVSIAEEALPDALAALRGLPLVREAMVVSTCNRLEVYAAIPSGGEGAASEIRAYLAEKDPAIAAHLYERTGLSAVRHLFRVCSSLDSMVVGEPQILGQVKAAYHKAEEARAVGGLLSRAVRHAFSVAKRVRTETDVGRAAVSMSFAAVELAGKVLGSLRGKKVLLVGAGKMSALAARHLVAAGCDGVLVTNRSEERARALAAEVRGSAHPWEDLDRLLVEVDVVVCSTAAPQPVIGLETLQAVRRSRRHRPLFLIDLAVPRDVDPRVNEIEDVYAFDVDDLDKVMEENRRSRSGEAFLAEGIVEREAEAFFAATWSEAEPLLRRLRLRAEEVARAEVARTLARHGEGLSDAQRQGVEALARALVNKILHQPTVRIREAGLRDDGAFLDVARALFDPEGEGAATVPILRPVSDEAEKEEPQPLGRTIAIVGSGNR